jgi:hypothetical protein
VDAEACFDLCVKRGDPLREVEHSLGQVGDDRSGDPFVERGRPLGFSGRHHRLGQSGGVLASQRLRYVSLMRLRPERSTARRVWWRHSNSRAPL